MTSHAQQHGNAVPGSEATLETLFERLDVRLDAFAMCEIENSCSLRCDPVDMLVVHFVLRGEGSIDCEHGSFRIRPGTMIVVPKKLAKRINGTGPVLTVIEAKETCPLTDGMVTFRACEHKADLVLGCGSVTAVVGEGFGLFDHLQQPLVEEANGELLPLLFNAILGELSNPGLGTKTIVESMMKQILILLVRDHLQQRGLASPLYMPLSNPQLSRALTAMIERPQERHTLDSLASIAGMSRSRFTHHFAAAFGRSPIDFLQLVRLRTGARLLRSSSLPIKAVAAAVGYASRSHFSRSFRSEFGVDPRTFREPHTESALYFAELEHSGAAPRASAKIGRQLLGSARSESA